MSGSEASRGSLAAMPHNGPMAVSSNQRAEGFAYWIDHLVVAGEVLPLVYPGVVAIVGGNNVGKSTMLRQIEEAVRAPGRVSVEPPAVLDRLMTGRLGGERELHDWLREKHLVELAQGRELIRGTGQDLTLAHWMLEPSNANHIAGVFVRLSRIEERAGMVNAVAANPDISAPASHPLHALRGDAALLQQFLDVASSVFGMTLTLDTLSGLVGFRVGAPTAQAPLVTEAYGQFGQQMGELPLLSAQGDGVRSALGTLLPVIANPPMVLLLDEPEAFLHPPQARELGRQLAHLAVDQGFQIILATHDKNLLTGLVEAGNAGVSVLHLKRDIDQASAQLLSSAQVDQLRSDPVLRYGDALDGLFHHAVVLVEDPKDAVFYTAALDELAGQRGMAAYNIQFLATYGKGNMAKVSRVLRALGISVVASPDLDILDNRSNVQNLVSAQGGAWADIEPDYQAATQQFRAARQAPSREWVATRVKQILGASSDSSLSAQELTELRGAVSSESAWKPLKIYGRTAFTEDPAAATRLLDALETLGVVVVRVGELERFLTDVTVAKGPDWLGKALEAGAHRTPEAQDHVKRILRVLGISITM